LKSISSTLEAGAALAANRLLFLKLWGKRVMKKRAKNLLIYAAIRAIGKRG
jgi:hypothetical protein